MQSQNLQQQQSPDQLMHGSGQSQQSAQSVCWPLGKTPGAPETFRAEAAQQHAEHQTASPAHECGGHRHLQADEQRLQQRRIHRWADGPEQKRTQDLSPTGMGSIQHNQQHRQQCERWQQGQHRCRGPDLNDHGAYRSRRSAVETAPAGLSNTSRPARRPSTRSKRSINSGRCSDTSTA